MGNSTGWVWAVVGAVLTGAPISAQTLNNQSLTGKYFFRHLSLGTDSTGKLVDPRSLLGTITFDGGGRYSFVGQQVQGNNAPAALTGSGTYAVDPAGFVAMDNPQRSGSKVNARWSPEALLGSTTESGDNAFDFLIAIPAPAASGSAPTLAGTYRTVTLEFPGGSTANVRNTIFNLTSSSAGKLADFTVNGHAANLSSGSPLNQQVTGASYSLGADGSGTANFGAASNASLLSGNRVLYLSADGNVVLGGSTSTGAHDILVGVKSVSGATNASWNSTFWGAGLRVNPGATPVDVSGYAGAAAARGTGKLTWIKRIKSLSFGSFDFTGINAYQLAADGSGTVELSQVGLGAGGKAVVGSAIHADDPDAYEVYFGAQVASLSGSGVFVNPQGITSAAGFTPVGSPISPGEFIAIFGTGLAKSTQTAKPPYPLTLNNVTVLVNGKQAPIYFVSDTQIDCLVPYSTQGTSATIVVQNNGANSNTVTVPVAATAPGVFSLDQSGSGAGAILHADFTLVNAARPAAAGETVLIFLTGMGAVSPAVADGTAAGSNPLSRSTASPISVLIGGEDATVQFAGLAPGFPGLYQMNVTLPALLPFSGSLPLAILTPNAVHDQVDIVVQ